jgi:AraC family transcriptional regulator
MERQPIRSDLFGKSLQCRKLSAFTLSERFYAPFFKTPAHTHENALFCLVLKGNYTESFGRARRECSPRTALFHASDDPHAEHFHADGGHSFIVEIDRPWIDRVRDEYGFPSVTSDFRSGVLPVLGLKLYREFRSFDEMSPLIVEGLMLEIAGEAARSSAASAPRRPRWLERTEEYLNDRVADPFSLSEVARFAGVHPVHLAQTFRRFNQISVGGYLRRLRLERARREILQTSRPIARIAADCGFSDQSHLSRTFKREFGITPQRFRDRFR